jgi:hypothetical protein
LRKGRRLTHEPAATYCPKLFFSRDYQKVQSAVQSLFVKPSNQLRIFKANTLCSPGSELHLIVSLTAIIVESEVIQKYIEAQHDLLDVFDLPEIISIECYKKDISALQTNPPISSLPPYLRLLLAMTLRDASIMICPDTGKVNFVDMDIKPLEKLKYYFSEVKRHG